MSSNRLNYDTCQYKQVINESVAPGHYMLNTPSISCEPCFPISPYTRIQNYGARMNTTSHLIDIDSELLNLTKQDSKCISNKWKAECPECKSNTGYPCGQGVTNGKRCTNTELPKLKDCELHTEETRISNPPHTLRETGINRWEWLCLDPQERIEIPFEWNVSNRIIVKDNHRPVIPMPLSMQPSLPPLTHTPCEYTTSVCNNPKIPQSVQWQQQNLIKQY